MNSHFPAFNRHVLTAHWLVPNLLLWFLVAILSFTYPVEELSRRLGDAFFGLRAQQPTSSAIAIVTIDDFSLERYGRWPWPRTRLAQIVNAISKERPASIGLDFLLSEPGASSGDLALAQAIHHAGNVVLAAKLSSDPDRLWIDPLSLFRGSAAAIGHVQMSMDPDGIGRCVPLYELSSEGPRWPLALEMARIAMHQPIRLDERVLAVGDKRIWIEGRSPRQRGEGWASYSAQFLCVDFQQQFAPGEANPPFLIISAAAVLDGHTPRALNGRNVFIGFGSSDLGDRIPTSVSRQVPMPGVEVHANLLQGLPVGRVIRHAGLLPQLLIVIVYSLVSISLVLRQPGWRSVWIPIVLFAASYGAGFLLFSRTGILLGFGPLLCAALLAVPLAQLQNLVIVNRALNRGLQQLRTALSVGPPAGWHTTSNAAMETLEPAPDLAQKLEIISKLQSELASLYTFRESLLQSMQEGLAIFDAAGMMQFRNPFWEKFCSRQGWNPDLRLLDFARRLEHPAWSHLTDTTHCHTLPAESEVYIEGGFWHIRALQLAAENNGGPRSMIVVTDLTSRLERDQARAEALRFVTHELRTPLVSIQGFAEFLLRYPNAEGATDAAATVFRESQRLVSLINTYLDVMRFDAGARSLRKEPVAIQEMVAQVEKVMAPIADSADIHIRVELEASLPALTGDPPMLSGVLLNLLNNAVKYSPSGSEVFLRVRRDRLAVVFEVRNPGEPIAAEQLAHLFEPFYRGHEHETSTPGWGLGLTFVRRIVEEHHGTIEAESDKRGIQVRVILPIDRKADERPENGVGPIDAGYGSDGPESDHPSVAIH